MIETLGWALVHFVWQGLVGGGMLALLLVALRRASAQARYLTSCSMLLLLACCPVINVVWLSSATVTSAPKQVTAIPDLVPGAFGITERSVPENPRPIPEAVVSEVALTAKGLNPSPIPTPVPTPRIEPASVVTPPAFADRIRTLVAPALPVCVACWLAGVVLLSVRLLMGWLTVQRVRRESVETASTFWQENLQRLAVRLCVSRPVQLAESLLVEVPTVIGWLRPTILLPVSALVGMEPAQLEALLAHELAHVRRCDYLVNLVQSAIETLLFYHPVVWWISKRIRAERENCCDDLVVELCSNRATYVRALTTMEELRGSPLLSVGADSGSLLDRIRRLTQPRQIARPSVRWGASLISLILVFSFVGGSYLISRSQADPGTSPQAGKANQDAPAVRANSKDQPAAKPAPVVAANERGLRYTVEFQRFQNPNAWLRHGSVWLTARLHNDGDKPVRVYWGDYAYPKMYQFDVLHESGWRPAVTRDWPDEHLPKAAGEKYFVTIPPGRDVSYQVLLSPDPSSGTEYCFFSRPGVYVITPSLLIVTNQILDRETGGTRTVPEAWTGQLQAAPFSIKIPGDPTQLEEGVQIRGQVVDPTGKPLPQAFIMLKHSVGSGGSKLMSYEAELERAITDAKGEFEFFRLPLETPSFILEVRHRDYQRGREVVFNRAPAGTTRRKFETKVTLNRGRTIRGRVLDSQGKPVSEVYMSVQGEHTTYTDPQGRFMFNGLAEKVPEQVRAFHWGYVDYPRIMPSAAAGNREWTITLRRESEQTVPGRATFIGGEPLRNLDLSFAVKALQPPAGSYRFPSQVFGAKTDDQGRFKVVLSELVEYQVDGVNAEAPWTDDNRTMRQSWRTTGGTIKPNQKELAFVFDNSHNLTADVRLVKPLPEGLSLAVRCRFADKSEVIEEIILPPEGGPVEFQKLSPGKYSVTVETIPERGLPGISRYVTIAPRAAGEKFTGQAGDSRLVIDVPDVRFGKVVGSVVTLDGKPAIHSQVYCAGQRWRNVNPEGRFEFNNVQAGKVTVTALMAKQTQGLAEIEVRDGQTTEVQLVLRPITERLATIAGRILYEDGSPVLGARVGFHDATAVTADGSYSVKFEPQQKSFPISLNQADGWPRFDRGERLKYPWERHSENDHIQVNLPLQAGKSIQRDIILDRSQLGRLTLHWNKPSQQVLAFVSVVPWKDALQTKKFPMAVAKIPQPPELDEELLITRSMSLELKQGEKLVIPDVPRGRRSLTLIDSYAHLRLFRPIPPDQTNVAVTFDSKLDGRLRFRVLDSAGKLRRDSGIELSLTLPGYPRQTLVSWQARDAKTLAESGGEKPENPYQKADGSFEFHSLEPGHYDLTIRDSDKTKTVAVEIKMGETSSHDVRLEDLGDVSPTQP